EQETPETQDVTPEESGAAAVPETEAPADAEAAAAEDADVESAQPESADAAESDAEGESATADDEDAGDAGDDDESAVEEDPAEEFKAELRMQEGDWYVIHSYAGYENRVKQNLENRTISLNLEEYIFESQ